MDTQDRTALHQHISPPDWLFQQHQPLFLGVTAAFLKVPGSDIQKRVHTQGLFVSSRAEDSIAPSSVNSARGQHMLLGKS